MQSPDTASREQQDSAHIAEGLEGTVATLMEPAVGFLTPDTTVAGALDYLVHALQHGGITYLYVVDDDHCLLGVLAMRDLLLSRPGQTLREVMTPEPFAFRADTPMSEAMQAALSRKHRLYPVVSEHNELLGLVFGWQLFEYLATEISSQTGTMVGLDKEERTSTPIFRAFLMRHPWLQVNLLTLGELADYPVSKLLRKEIVLGAMNGFFVGLIAAAAMWFYAGSTGTEQPAVLALVILVAMVGACVGSGIFGVLVPLTLRRFGADPAMASSIFLTTFTDVLGMGLMLFLATSLLL